MRPVSESGYSSPPAGRTRTNRRHEMGHDSGGRCAAFIIRHKWRRKSAECAFIYVFYSLLMLFIEHDPVTFSNNFHFSLSDIGMKRSFFAANSGYIPGIVRVYLSRHRKPVRGKSGRRVLQHAWSKANHKPLAERGTDRPHKNKSARCELEHFFCIP